MQRCVSWDDVGGVERAWMVARMATHGEARLSRSDAPAVAARCGCSQAGRAAGQARRRALALLRDHL